MPSIGQHPGSTERRKATFERFCCVGERRISRRPSTPIRTTFCKSGPGSIRPAQFFVSTTKMPNGVTAR